MKKFTRWCCLFCNCDQARSDACVKVAGDILQASIKNIDESLAAKELPSGFLYHMFNVNNAEKATGFIKDQLMEFDDLNVRAENGYFLTLTTKMADFIRDQFLNTDSLATIQKMHKEAHKGIEDAGAREVCYRTFIGFVAAIKPEDFQDAIRAAHVNEHSPLIPRIEQ